MKLKTQGSKSSKSSSKREAYSGTSLPQETNKKNSQVKKLNHTTKEQGKEQMKPQGGRRKEIKKIRAEMKQRLKNKKKIFF